MYLKREKMYRMNSVAWMMQQQMWYSWVCLYLIRYGMMLCVGLLRSRSSTEHFVAKTSEAIFSFLFLIFVRFFFL